MKMLSLICLLLLGCTLWANGRNEYRDKDGRLLGSAREKNGKVEYRDKDGRLKASERSR